MIYYMLTKSRLYGIMAIWDPYLLSAGGHCFARGLWPPPICRHQWYVAVQLRQSAKPKYCIRTRGGTDGEPCKCGRWRAEITHKEQFVATASKQNRGGKMRIEIFCPVCAAAGIKRKLMEVDDKASGVIYPYCKGCKKNIEIKLVSKEVRK